MPAVTKQPRSAQAQAAAQKPAGAYARAMAGPKASGLTPVTNAGERHNSKLRRPLGPTRVATALGHPRRVTAAALGRCRGTPPPSFFHATVRHCPHRAARARPDRRGDHDLVPLRACGERWTHDPLPRNRARLRRGTREGVADVTEAPKRAGVGGGCAHDLGLGRRTGAWGAGSQRQGGRCRSPHPGASPARCVDGTRSRIVPARRPPFVVRGLGHALDSRSAAFRVGTWPRRIQAAACAVGIGYHSARPLTARLHRSYASTEQCSPTCAAARSLVERSVCRLAQPALLPCVSPPICARRFSMPRVISS